MTILHFSGIVSGAPRYNCYDDEDTPEDEREQPVTIGGEDVLAAVQEATFTGPVTIAFADKSWTGDLYAEEGWGYSEYTPMDPDTLAAGGEFRDANNVLAILAEHYQNQHVDMWVADEPFNTLADREPPSHFGRGGPQAQVR